jgi:superfamily I DNA/RNA helicase
MKRTAGDRRCGLLAALEGGISSLPDAGEGRRRSSGIIRAMREQGKQSARAAFNHVIEAVNYRDYIELETTDALERLARIAVVEEFLEAAGEHDSRLGGGLAKFVEDLSRCAIKRRRTTRKTSPRFRS